MLRVCIHTYILIADFIRQGLVKDRRDLNIERELVGARAAEFEPRAIDRFSGHPLGAHLDLDVLGREFAPLSRQLDVVLVGIL